MNTIHQNGKTYSTNSRYQLMINDKHYTGFDAWIRMVMPLIIGGLVFIGIILSIGYWAYNHVSLSITGF